MNIIKRVLLDTVDSFINPFPGCPYCNRRERVLTIARILFLVGLLWLGNKVIDMTEHSVDNICWDYLAEVNNRSANMYPQKFSINNQTNDTIIFSTWT